MPSWPVRPGGCRGPAARGTRRALRARRPGPPRPRRAAGPREASGRHAARRAPARPRARSRTVNSAPLPSPSLAALTVPPCSSTSCFTSVSPIPSPPSVRASVGFAWAKSSKIESQLVRWNPGAVVAHAQHRLAVLDLERDPDRAPGRRVLGGVVHQVGEHLLKPDRVAEHGHGSVRKRQVELLLLRVELGPLGLDREADCGSQVHGRPLELDAAAGDARHVEQVVEQPREVVRLAAHHAARALRARLERGARVDERDRVHDHGERVAQLVGQHGEELVLAAVGAHRLLARGVRLAPRGLLPAQQALRGFLDLDAREPEAHVLRHRAHEPQLLGLHAVRLVVVQHELSEQASLVHERDESHRADAFGADRRQERRELRRRLDVLDQDRLRVARLARPGRMPVDGRTVAVGEARPRHEPHHPGVVEGERHSPAGRAPATGSPGCRRPPPPRGRGRGRSAPPGDRASPASARSPRGAAGRAASRCCRARSSRRRSRARGRRGPGTR